MRCAALSIGICRCWLISVPQHHGTLRYQLDRLGRLGKRLSHQHQQQLFGAQVGGSWQRRWGLLRLGLVGKAGIYGNEASQRTFLGDFGNTFVFATQRPKDRTLPCGATGVNETIDITKTFSFVSATT